MNLPGVLKCLKDQYIPFPGYRPGHDTKKRLKNNRRGLEEHPSLYVVTVKVSGDPWSPNYICIFTILQCYHGVVLGVNGAFLGPKLIRVGYCTNLRDQRSGENPTLQSAKSRERPRCLSPHGRRKVEWSGLWATDTRTRFRDKWWVQISSSLFRTAKKKVLSPHGTTDSQYRTGAVSDVRGTGSVWYRVFTVR